MADPACKFDWRYEGYLQVWLYNGTGEADEVFQDPCYEVAHRIMDATSVAELHATIERLAAERGLIVRQYPGPSHDDPLAGTYRVGVFKEPPPGWPSEEPPSPTV